MRNTLIGWKVLLGDSSSHLAQSQLSQSVDESNHAYYSYSGQIGMQLLLLYFFLRLTFQYYLTDLRFSVLSHGCTVLCPHGFPDIQNLLVSES